ncbi:MAG: M28 family peptidase [Spirochaetota bacterium]
MGAHYDSYSDSPGADDNASSVAVLIELLRSLAHRAHELTTPLELAFWACEEPPAFSSNAMGSDRHASYLRSRGIGVGLVVILEMVGYYSDRQTVRTINFTSDDGTRGRTLLPARGDFLLVTGTDGIVVGDADVALREAGLRTVALPAYTDLLDICDGLNWSDTKRLLITDTGMYRNPHYHRVTDRPGTLDFGRIAMLAEGLASFLFR